MHFGIFDHMDNDHLPVADFLEERLRLLELYDRHGFYCWHVAEHHATTLGMAPSPNVMLAAASQRTSRLRFGPMVYALPIYHPMRLAEEIAMVDQLSRGRLDVGFGRGSSPTEIAYFGIDPEVRETAYRELLPRVLGALETGVLANPHLEDPYKAPELKIQPYQKPFPPVWYGVHTAESAERAAKRGWATINLDMDYEARECNEVFRDVWAKEQSGRPLPLMGLGRFVVVGETDDAALAIARRAYPHWHAGFTHLFRKLGLMQSHPRPDTWDILHGQGKGVAGSPDTVAAFLRDQLTTAQCNYCVVQIAFGDQTLAETARSIELFASDVMPALHDVCANLAVASPAA